MLSMFKKKTRARQEVSHECSDDQTVANAALFIFGLKQLGSPATAGEATCLLAMVIASGDPVE